MRYIFHFPVWESFRPFPESKEVLLHMAPASLSAVVPEIEPDRFPQAYLIRELRKLYDRDNWRSAREEPYQEEIRRLDGQCYRPVRESFGGAVSKTVPPLSYLKEYLEHMYSLLCEDNVDSESRFGSRAVILGSNRAEAADYFKDRSCRYLVCGNRLWEKCCEPRYCVQTYRFRGRKYTELRISRFHSGKNDSGSFSAHDYQKALRFFNRQLHETRSIPLPYGNLYIVQADDNQTNRQKDIRPPVSMKPRARRNLAVI